MIFGKAPLETIVIAAISATTVTGHGGLVVPAVVHTYNGDVTSYMATVDAATSGFKVTSGPAADKATEFAAALTSSQYSTLKEFVQAKMVLKDPQFTKECGYTDPKAPPQPLPAHYVEWGHGPQEGLTLTHCGWCEIHCGDQRVFYSEDCPTNYPMVPAQLPYDRDACLGAPMLEFYWIALHGDPWQVYINCAPLQQSTSTGMKSKFAADSGGNNSTTSLTSSNAGISAAGGTGNLTPPAPSGTGISTPPASGVTEYSTTSPAQSTKDQQSNGTLPSSAPTGNQGPSSSSQEYRNEGKTGTLVPRKPLGSGNKCVRLRRRVRQES